MSNGWKKAATTVAASAAAVTLNAQDARAQDEEASFGGGAFVGIHFGSSTRFEWGVEAFATRIYQESFCSSTEKRWGFGGFAQLSLLGLGQPRITLGGHAGGELERAVSALSGELGASYRFGADGGFGIHSGVLAEAVLLNVSARYQWLLHEAFVGVGARFLPTYGEPSLCAIGRPLRTASGLLALCTPRRASRDERNGARSIAAVGRAYERDAQLEHASVPAFLQLARELSTLGAPSALIAGALASARDELRHAEMCTMLAREYLGETAAPALPPFAARAPLTGEAGYLRLAIESWLDGCVSEGRAAAQASRAAEVAAERRVRDALQHIAEDEHRHAQLAWSILTWALRQGGESAREVVRRLRDVDMSLADDHALEGLEDYGRLSQPELDAIADRHAASSRARLDALLARA